MTVALLMANTVTRPRSAVVEAILGVIAGGRISPLLIPAAARS